ncbi:hypothetical protein DFH09DRAFT_1460606 [Mycena vulgaris]|nr:hypothetical protein DFH09DRAFT_1460606 [Mycena vulgaris]
MTQCAVCTPTIMVTEYSADPFARRAYQRPWRRERPTSAPPVVKIPPSDAGIPASEERLLYVQRRKAHPSRWRHRYLPRKTLAGPTSRPPPISHTQTVRMKEARAQWGSGATRALIGSHSPIASDARGKDSKVDTRGDDDSTLIPAGEYTPPSTRRVNRRRHVISGVCAPGLCVAGYPTSRQGRDAVFMGAQVERILLATSRHCSASPRCDRCAAGSSTSSRRWGCGGYVCHGEGAKAEGAPGAAELRVTRGREETRGIRERGVKSVTRARRDRRMDTDLSGFGTKGWGTDRIDLATHTSTAHPTCPESFPRLRARQRCVRRDGPSHRGRGSGKRRQSGKATWLRDDVADLRSGERKRKRKEVWRGTGRRRYGDSEAMTDWRGVREQGSRSGMKAGLPRAHRGRRSGVIFRGEGSASDGRSAVHSALSAPFSPRPTCASTRFPMSVLGTEKRRRRSRARKQWKQTKQAADAESAKVGNDPNETKKKLISGPEWR